jgi:hypothetical protein
MLLVIPVTLLAQKDVTQFLGVPVDGSKSEMIQKLMDKGFTIDPNEKDVLNGEFNGTKVYIVIATNNNKVRRLAVVDANPTSEGNIKNRFNSLLRQFQSNKKYIPTEDSTLLKYTIPEDEDISYELSVKKKAYQAVFYQKTTAYDSLTSEQNTQEEQLGKVQTSDIVNLAEKQINELYKCFNKKVWVNVSKRSGGFSITIFYDNVYNEANGEDL